MERCFIREKTADIVDKVEILVLTLHYEVEKLEAFYHIVVGGLHSRKLPRSHSILQHLQYAQ